MKKRAAALLLAILTLFTGLFSGCSGNKSGGAQSYSIPQNGIVAKADLEKIKASGGLVIYKGSADGIPYEWTFVGPDIQNPAAVNLKVSFRPADEMAMQKQAGGGKIFAFALAQKGALPGKPSLSITVGKDWTYGSYNLYAYAPGAPAAAGSVQVVDGVATLSLANSSGEYFFTKDKIGSAVSSSSAASSAASAAAAGGSAVSRSAASHAAAGGSAASQAAPKTGGGNAGDAKGNSTPSSKAQPGGGSNTSTPAPASHPPSGSQKIHVTITIRCDTAVANWKNLKANKQDHSVVPANGCILPVTTETVSPGETAYDLLVYVCERSRIQMQHKGSAGSEYIQSINNLYEFDCGPLSGWTYCVNGRYPNYGVSKYVLKNGDAVQFSYTCNLGRDLVGAAAG